MRTCQTCHKSIVALNAQARYCSTRCRVKACRQKNQIPIELTSRNRWVRYRADKTPLTLTGHNASSTNPATWTTWNAAQNSKIGVGPGFVLGDGIACIDLDHCLIDGIPTPATLAILKRYPGNYIETSPSGDGLHIWGLMHEQAGTRRVENGVHIETYSRGRYITITGQVFQAGKLLPL
jgi:primase-polymerase (primpol)-like protein